MTPAPHDPEQDLSQTLARQAERFAQRGNALELDQVISRAGEIRRGRRMRASMVMAAVVLAVAVPVGITALNDNDPTRKEDTSQFLPASPDTSNVELGEYKVGDAPKTGYADGSTLKFNGTSRFLGGDSVTSLSRINGGFLVGQSDDGGNLNARFVPDQGDDSETRTLAGGFAVSSQRQFGAFVETDGTVIVVDSTGSFTEIGKLPGGKDVSYSAVAVSDSACYTAESCSVWAVDNGESSTVWEVTPGTDPVKSELTGLIAVDAYGNNVRRLSYDDELGATSGYFDVDGNQVWKSSEYYPRSFSPDGTHLIAGPAYGDGYAEQQVTILDNAGKPTLDLKSATDPDGNPVSVLQVVWEDDDHVLAVVAEGTRFAVIRFGLNGSREYAVPLTTVADSYDTSPFRLG